LARPTLHRPLASPIQMVIVGNVDSHIMYPYKERESARERATERDRETERERERERERIDGDPTFAHTTFAQKDICPFAQKTFVQKDVCPKDIWQERHLPRRYLPTRTFTQKMNSA
jgi:hypothetical protein